MPRIAAVLDVKLQSSAHWSDLKCWLSQRSLGSVCLENTSYFANEAMNPLQLEFTSLPYKLQKEVSWRKTDKEKLMLASSLQTQSWLLMTMKSSFPFLVFSFPVTVWCRVLYSLLLSSRIFSDKLQKKMFCLTGSYCPVSGKQTNKQKHQQLRILPFLADVGMPGMASCSMEMNN